MAKQPRNLRPTFAAMQVELVQWPSEEQRLAEIRRDDVPRLVLVPEGVAPPLTADVLEDWIRLPADRRGHPGPRAGAEDRAERHRGRQRARARRERPAPGGGRWVSLPPVEHRLMVVLLDRYRAVSAATPSPGPAGPTASPAATCSTSTSSASAAASPRSASSSAPSAAAATSSSRAARKPPPVEPRLRGRGRKVEREATPGMAFWRRRPEVRAPC